MYRMTALNWQEPAAYSVAALAVVLGVFGGFMTEPAWLSRAGSVVIVCGVLLAASRKFDVLTEKVHSLIDEHIATKADDIFAEHTNPDGTPISKSQALALKKKLNAEAKREVGEVIEEKKRIFKLHEVGLVVVGTLINGFGEWAVKLILSVAT